MPTLASENLKLSSCANGEQDSENAVSPFVHTALVKLLDDHHHDGSFSDSPLGKQVVPTPHNDDHSWPINISATLMLTNGWLSTWVAAPRYANRLHLSALWEAAQCDSDSKGIGPLSPTGNCESLPITNAMGIMSLTSHSIVQTVQLLLQWLDLVFLAWLCSLVQQQQYGGAVVSLALLASGPSAWDTGWYPAAGLQCYRVTCCCWRLQQLLSLHNIFLHNIGINLYQIKRAQLSSWAFQIIINSWPWNPGPMNHQVTEQVWALWAAPLAIPWFHEWFHNIPHI